MCARPMSRLACLFLLLLLAGCASRNSTPATITTNANSEPVFSVLAERKEAVPSTASVASADTNSTLLEEIAPDSEFEDYDEDFAPLVDDPWEGFNRAMFSFNDFLLLKVVKPVYHGYAAVTPDSMRSGLTNARHNLMMPIRFGNCLLQGRFGEAVIELGKFIVNSTAGFGGFADVTKGKQPKIPVGREADFGQTLAVWGVGEGIYVVWPIIGPSTIRDTAGWLVDSGTSPYYWATEPTGKVAWLPALGSNVLLHLNDFGSSIETYETITQGAIEPYIAVRDAYVTYRRGYAGQRPAVDSKAGER